MATLNWFICVYIVDIFLCWSEIKNHKRKHSAKTNLPMGTNCAPLLPDLFLYSYQINFIHELLKNNEKKLVPFFNFTFGYIDDDVWWLCSSHLAHWAWIKGYHKHRLVWPTPMIWHCYYTTKHIISIITLPFRLSVNCNKHVDIKFSVHDASLE